LGHDLIHATGQSLNLMRNITGKSQPCAWANVGRSGMLVEKPINVPELLGLIRQALTESTPSRKERIAVQHNLTRHTRPLPDSFYGHGFHRGGSNE
jgi:hypothetical protein